jgi:vitamin B12 transporter
MPYSIPRGLCLLASLIPFAAHADAGAAAPEMTVTATRVSTLLPDVPAGVTVITAAEMQARGYTTLVQALSAVPGLGVVQSGGPGNQASVFVRGTNSEDVLVLLDGVPVNDPSEANGAFNFGTTTLNDIARVEVVRGPMSGLYGSNAIGGVINIITVQGAGAPKVDFSAAGGWPAQGQGGATLSGASGKFDYALTGALDQEAGFDATARRLQVYAANRDPFRSKLGSLNLGYAPVDGTRISLQLRAQQTDAAFPDLGYPIYDDPDEYQYNTNLFGKLGVTSNLFNGLLTTELFAARLQNTLHVSNLLDANDPNQAAADEHYHGIRDDLQWNNTVHIPDFGPAEFSSLLFGVEYLNDRSKFDIEDASFGTPFTGGSNNSQHTVAGHAGVQTTLAGRLTLTGALRDDAVSSFGNALTGRIGGVLAVPEAALHVKASYGTGFLAPSLFDLYGQESFGGFPDYQGNPNLKAEHSSGYDAGLQFDIPALGHPDVVSISATYYFNNLTDLIAPTPDFSSVENIGHARISGVETELLLNPCPWASADLTYTYTYARDVTDGTPLLRRPENAGSATVTLTPLPSISIVPQVEYTGRFTDYLYGDDGYPLGDGLSEPGTVVNLTANYAVTPQYSLFAQAKNLFQSKFEPVNGLQIAGQSFLFGIRGRLGI